MWKAILHTVKATFPIIGLSALCTSSVFAQQNIIANKDNTRPETTKQYDMPARITGISVTKFNGYNEIQWNAAIEQNTRYYTVEYSYDGINFQSAGQVLSTNGVYSLKHYTPNTKPLLYRIRMGDFNGKLWYSDNILLDGIPVVPVKIYPTVVTGNVVNVNAGFPVERITVVSADGQQVLAKDMNGTTDFFRITIPELKKGWYLITFYGNGWKSTSKFMVG